MVGFDLEKKVKDLTGHFLIAMPSLDRSMYSGSVVYVTEHSYHGGATGVIINKPLGCLLKNALRDTEILAINSSWEGSLLYLGGPVSSDASFVLYDAKFKERGGSFQLTNDKKVFKELLSGEYKDSLFVSVGYSAWMPWQLESELSHNFWLVVQSNPDIIYEVDPIDRYNEALKLLGIKNAGSLYLNHDVHS